MWQTEHVARLLEDNGLKTEISSMETRGDKILDRSIAKIGSKGVFTEELEEQLAGGVTDIAVHSAKDMQSVLPEGFELIAFTEREQVHDVLVSRNGALDPEQKDRPFVIGTSSVRRRALLRHYYPHLEVVEMRGNLQTRIRKMDEGVCDALLLAYAGVRRMGYGDLIVHAFSVSDFVPPVGQGCIAIEAATSLDPELKRLICLHVNKSDSEAALLAERAFLEKLEGGCSIPAFGHAEVEGEGLILTCGLVSLDGTRLIQESFSGNTGDPVALGYLAGETILDQGGREILEAIKKADR